MIKFDDHTPPQRKDAYYFARRLARRLLSTPETPRKMESPGQRTRVERLHTAELPGLMLYAGILVRVNAAQARTVRERVDRRWALPIARTELRTAVDADTPSVTLAYDIVERYVRRQAILSARTHYNVACFYANVGGTSNTKDGCFERALVELDLALADANLLAWAKGDRSLLPLEAGRPSDWYALLARHDASAPAASPEPEAIDPLVASLAVFAAGHGTASTVRPGIDVDFEVVTSDGVILVKAVTAGAATTVNVQALVAAAALWSTPEEKLAGTILMLAPDVTILPNALALAARARTRVMRLSSHGRMMETLG